MQTFATIGEFAATYARRVGICRVRNFAPRVTLPDPGKGASPNRWLKEFDQDFHFGVLSGQNYRPSHLRFLSSHDILYIIVPGRRVKDVMRLKTQKTIAGHREWGSASGFLLQFFHLVGKLADLPRQASYGLDDLLH